MGMKYLYRTLIFTVLYVFFLFTKIDDFWRVCIFLLLLVIQSMNTALQVSQLRKDNENIPVKVITTIFNIIVLGMCMLFAITMYFVY